ncbi:hypothetical protein DDT56_13145 [Brenneria corticis]|uniref:Uncharacterized protein n=1 Tax=Brenneria corticis TaxID=2173106 RepID=A0A2U1TYN2_9GAMM|nr:hypothetical protein DDT56_13145 [Brenneria sp. CFCC 11842]
MQKTHVDNEVMTMTDVTLMRRFGRFFIKYIKNKKIAYSVPVVHQRLTVLSDLLIIIRLLTINRILYARRALRGQAVPRRIFVFPMINKSDFYVN